MTGVIVRPAKTQDQLVYPPKISRVLSHPYLDSFDAVEEHWVNEH